MSRRKPDVVTIESTGRGKPLLIDRATQFEVTTDLTAPSEARFELGNDATYQAIRDSIGIGARFSVYVNGLARLTGRALTRGQPISADSGATVQLAIRTLLADAEFTSCPEFNIKKTTLHEAILKAYEPLGLTESDFVFQADLARHLVTGKSIKGGKPPADLIPIKEDAARVHPPETIRSFAERHLNRFHLTHWDAPDGRIVVGAPNDTQGPSYSLRLHYHANAQVNNVESAEKIEDYEGVPSELFVYGQGAKLGLHGAKVQAFEVDPVLSRVRPALTRRVAIIDDGITTAALAEARARREMSLRSLTKDSWRFTIDGLSHWDGSSYIGFGVDTVADVLVDADKKTSGAYLVYRVAMTGDPNGGYTTQLETCARGIWRL